MQTETRRLTLNGLGHDVHVWSAQTRKKRGVAVLVHGFQDTGQSFDLVAPRLAAEGLECFAPDLRGFGNTERVRDGSYYHFPDYLFDLADLIDHVSPEGPVFLVGHSMGGTISSLYAGSFPERVALLALLEGLGPPDMPDAISPDRVRSWIDGVRAARAKAERPMTYEVALRRLRAGHPAVPEEVLAMRVKQLTRPLTTTSGSGSESGELVWRFDALHRTTSPIAFAAGRWRAHAARIAAPTLFVGGGKTGFHPDDEAARIAIIPDNRTHELEGAGHMMHWTQPRELGELLLDFFRERRGVHFSEE